MTDVGEVIYMDLTMEKFFSWRMILVLVIILSFVGSFFSNHKWISSETIEKLILLTVPEIRSLNTLETNTKEPYDE